MDLTEKNAYLEEIGCCRRCCLRYLGKQNPESFQSSDDKADEEEQGETPTKILKISPCITCIGLLQDPLIDSVVKMVTAQLNEADYDCNNFSFAISLPVSFQLRIHAMLLHMIDKFPAEGKPEARFVSVKEVFKMVAGAKISRGVNKIFDSSGNSPLLINANFSYEDDEGECAPL